MKKKFCKLSAIFIALIMMFTVVVLPNVEAALPVDVNKKCSLEISISSHSYAEDLSKNDVQADLYRVASISQGGNYTGLDAFKDIDWSTVKYDATQSAKTWKQRASEASKVIKDAILAAYKQKGHEQLYWDEITDRCLKDIYVTVTEVLPEEIVEVDTVEELEALEGRLA